MQKKNIATKSVAVAVAFSMAFTLATGVKADAAKKAPKLNKSTLTLDVGKKATLKVVKNKNKISAVTWKTTKKTVAKVTKKGVVKAVAAGKATIKAIFKVTGAKKKTTLKCKVTVNEASTPEPTPLVGTWTTATDPKLTDDVKALVTKYTEGLTGSLKIDLTPYALLATQVVNGTGYRVLCRADITDETGKKTSSFSILQLYADTSGALISDASTLLAFMDDFASEMVGVTADTTAVGGFTQFDDPTIPEERRAAFEEFFKEKNIPFPYKPIARLSYRSSTSEYDVSLVCEKELESSGNIGTDEPTGYFVIKMTLDNTKKHVKTSSMMFPISFVATDYSIAGVTIRSVEVETQAAWIRSYIMDGASGDTTALTKLADLIQYPITIDGTTYNSKLELAAAFATNKIDENLLKEIRRTTCMQLFTNAQGIMLGSGEHTVWLNLDAEKKDTLKITAINGLFAK